MFIDPDSVTDCFADLRSELNKAHNFIKEGSTEDAKNAIEKVSFGLRIMKSIFDCALPEAAAEKECNEQRNQCQPIAGIAPNYEEYHKRAEILEMYRLGIIDNSEVRKMLGIGKPD